MGMARILLLTLVLAAPGGWGQNNNRPIQRNIFYMDSNADCNGPVREIYGQTVKVVGHGAIQEQQGPTSCTLTLRSATNFDHTKLLLQVVAANIHDCDVQLVMYDGDPGQGTLRGYDCNSPNKLNERNYVTTGDTVSFVLSRRNVISSQYDIQINVQPLATGTKPGYENDYGDSWGFFREKLENDIAVGIVGAAFLLVIIVCAIVLIFCYRRYLGLNKPWERHQLSTFRSPNSIYETKSKMSDTSSDVWASNMSRGRVEPPRRRIETNGRMARPSEDEDSVFDSDSYVTPKKQLVDQDRRWDRYRERERDRHRGRGRDTGSNNSSYVQADDDHPQDTFVERIIEPRVRSRRTHKPPPYDEAINESETEKSDFDDDDDDDEEDDVDKPETSDEESEKPSTEEEEEEEEESEVEDGNIAAAPKPAPRPRTQPPPPPNAVPLHPGLQPQPGYPGYPPMGYMGSYPMAPGQFVPIVAAPPPQAQPLPPTVAGPGHPPPSYPGQRPPGSVRPTDPPIYSYLVQRGYTPLDAGQDGSANTSRSQNSLDDVDRNVVSSGVEYMRR